MRGRPKARPRISLSAQSLRCAQSVLVEIGEGCGGERPGGHQREVERGTQIGTQHIIGGARAGNPGGSCDSVPSSACGACGSWRSTPAARRRVRRYHDARLVEMDHVGEAMDLSQNIWLFRAIAPTLARELWRDRNSAHCRMAPPSVTKTTRLSAKSSRLILTHQHADDMAGDARSHAVRGDHILVRILAQRVTRAPCTSLAIER